MRLMDKTVAAIKPVSPEWISKAFARLDSLTKPRRSLGYLEDLAARYVAIREEGHGYRRAVEPCDGVG